MKNSYPIIKGGAKPTTTPTCLKSVARVEITTVFFFVLLVLALDGVLRIFAPFSGAILSAICLAITFYPLHGLLKRRTPHWNAALHALILVIGISCLLILPLFLISWAVASESQALSGVIKSWSATLGQWSQGNFGSHNRWVAHVLNGAQRFGLSPAELQGQVSHRLEGLLGSLTALSAVAAQHTFGFAMHTLLMLFTLFFCFRDGPSFLDWLTRMLPLAVRDTRLLFHKTEGIVSGVVRGWFLTSLVQGVLATIGYWIIHLEGAVLLGVLTAAIGLLPVVGTFGVWIPIVIYLFVKGMVGKAVFMLLWGALVVVALIDTWVRPYLIGQRVDLGLFALFFALLGGVEAFGIKGVILGPWLMAITPVLLEMYYAHYRKGDAHP